MKTKELVYALTFFCYNVQPGIKINYKTGENEPVDGLSAYETVSTAAPTEKTANVSSDDVKYIGNKNTKKFHYPTCNGVAQTKKKNEQYLTGTREEIISKGYEPCGICKP